MKKLFLLFALLTGISTLTLVAQPSLTSAINPQVGNILLSAIYTDSIIYTPGPSGANQSWDFSALTAGYTTRSWYLSHTSDTDFASHYPGDFPNANIVSFSRDITSISGDSLFVYSNVSDTQSVSWGQESNEEKIIYSNKGKIQLTYPFNYNQTLTAAFAAQVVNAAGTFARTGTATVTADGYGTLTMPQGVFFNTLRINRKENMTDTGTLGGDGTYRYANQTYEWYSGTFGYNLLTLNFDTLFYTFLDSEYVYPSYSVTYGLEAASAVKDITPSFSFTAFPNPASKSVSVKASEAIKRITISNELGQNLIDLHEEYTIPNNAVEISVAGLPTGIYMCTVVTSAGTATKKLVKE